MVLMDTPSFGITIGKNTLLPGMPTAGDLFPNAVAAGPTSQLVEDLLQGNRAFREDVFNADPELYQGLAQGQSPGTISRVI